MFTVRAWLERERPAGEDIVLPVGSGTLVFGRSARSTLVFDASEISPRHCELSWDRGFWKLRDLGSDLGTRVNGLTLTHSRALFDGDQIEFGGVQLRFRSDLQVDDTELLEAISRDPTVETSWLVYADQLQERGDPLGERITRGRSGNRIDHMPWLGPLWDAFVAGELEIDWHWGFVRRATIRTAAGRMPTEWRELASMLFGLRIGKLVRGLTIDLPRLQNLTPLQIPEAVIEAQRSLAGLPSLPTSLERLSLGYHVAQPAAGTLMVVDELARRVPRLKDTPVYQRAQGVRLHVIGRVPGVVLNGIEENRVLAGVTRMRRGQRNQLVLESPPGIPFMADGNPCYFSFTEGRAQLIAGRMRGEVRVNNRIDSLFSLLPDDVIDVQAGAKFRVELVP